VHPDDLPRFAALDVTASVQFTHATEDQELADAIWGDRAEHGYPNASLLAAAARLVAGSDAPYQEIDPRAGVRAAVFRTVDGRPPWRPHQTIEVGDALAAFTREPAWLERAEAFRGRLAGGLAADLVVLSHDPFERPGDARVRATMLAGRWTHQDHRPSPGPGRKDEA
jgi:predicted amidohydrolase YtcJ